ncbi:Hpt domain-containing protein [Breoghania sp.]|uniref:Hpt domain-containing protein n=1 Tax=Breoghania sp. TaxID=2065378 RepID=UPI002AA72B72|nr:Hpt domain-containing protein [Breoghania sp.]
MSQTEQATWNDLYETLRAKYLKAMPERLETLEAMLREIEHCEDPGLLREDLTFHAHKIVGSGKTYGFDAISAQARRLEDALRDFSLTLDEATRPAGALIKECRKVISSGPTG